MRNKIIKLLILPTFILFSFSLFSQKTINYSGGMFYGYGLYKVENQFTNTNAHSNAIGGRMGIYLHKNFFTSIMGNRLTLNYSNNSNIRKTYFGVSGEYVFDIKSFQFGIGIWSGAGVIKGMHISQIEDNHISDADFYSDRLLYAFPYCQLTYKMSDKFHLISLIDYAPSFSNTSKSKLEGINFRIGLMFNRGH